jgi:hypothetical protein
MAGRGHFEELEQVLNNIASFSSANATGVAEPVVANPIQDLDQLVGAVNRMNALIRHVAPPAGLTPPPLPPSDDNSNQGAE